MDNHKNLFKKDTIIIPPYFGSLLRESAPQSEDAENRAPSLCIWRNLDIYWDSRVKGYRKQKKQVSEE